MSHKNVMGGFPGGAVVKNQPANAGTRVRSLVAQWLRIRLPMQGHGFDPWWHSG